MAQLLGSAQGRWLQPPLLPQGWGGAGRCLRGVARHHPCDPAERSALGGMPAADGPHKTLYSRCRRWPDKGVFDLIFSESSASDATKPEVLMIDATDLKAHPTASSLNKGVPPA